MNSENERKKPLVVVHLDNDEEPLDETRRALLEGWQPDFAFNYIPILGSRIDLINYVKDPANSIPDLLIVDMKMLKVTTPDMKTEYFENTSEGKKAVEDFRQLLGGGRAGNVYIVFLTQLGRWADDVHGVQNMGYEVLHKDHFKQAMNRIREILTWLATR